MFPLCESRVTLTESVLKKVSSPSWNNQQKINPPRTCSLERTNGQVF